MSRAGFRREFERGMMGRLAGGMVRFLVRKGVSPFALTYSSFILAIASSILYALSSLSNLLPPIAGFALLASGFFDAIDGEVARLSAKTTRLGAFMDSMLDKAAEALICVGILLSGLADPLAVLLFCASSLLVSYARARADGVGVSLSGVGVAERAERLVLVSAASLIVPIYPAALNLTLYTVAALASATVVWRTLHVVRFLRNESRPSEA
ncbi:MAG: CDP-alcohol phosphatidyltransferase family protein [Nitrososphaerota archaeon]|nr:CDP-alcohol phosphatidyltransferase family protein [Candidatus Calditenuaceae archaeon]MDW8072706.1 CDP-alcohol phosphatidyltransferase family protein [Nitrososphaerota archaeon]